jgi:hypothetical protein
MSTALGSSIRVGTPVRYLPSDSSAFPGFSRHYWQDSQVPELAGTELYVAIGTLQAPVGATDFSFLKPGDYSIKHDTTNGSSRIKVTSLAPGGSTSFISASDSGVKKQAYFFVTKLSRREAAHLQSLAEGSEARLKVDRIGGFTVTPGPEASEEAKWWYHMEGKTGKSKLSECWHSNIQS